MVNIENNHQTTTYMNLAIGPSRVDILLTRRFCRTEMTADESAEDLMSRVLHDTAVHRVRPMFRFRICATPVHIVSKLYNVDSIARGKHGQTYNRNVGYHNSSVQPSRSRHYYASCGGPIVEGPGLYRSRSRSGHHPWRKRT